MICNHKYMYDPSKLLYIICFYMAGYRLECIFWRCCKNLPYSAICISIVEERVVSKCHHQQLTMFNNCYVLLQCVLESLFYRLTFNSIFDLTLHLFSITLFIYYSFLAFNILFTLTSFIIILFILTSFFNTYIRRLW